MEKLHHYGIEVTDIKKSIEFYTEVLGFELQLENRDTSINLAYAFLKLEHLVLELLMPLDAGNNSGEIANKKITFPYSPHIALSTESIKIKMEELAKKEIEIIAGPFEDEYDAKWFFICDRDNNVIEFLEGM